MCAWTSVCGSGRRNAWSTAPTTRSRPRTAPSPTRS
ncbi:MAG: hypothetical protein GY715_02315 [Planctomycetes bacterium]|nr:hypothetical protein [Planctomycetota bacterium]